MFRNGRVVAIGALAFIWPHTSVWGIARVIANWHRAIPPTPAVLLWAYADIASANTSISALLGALFIPKNFPFKHAKDSVRSTRYHRHIGLQFQIEHHLYPRLPRHNLRKARKLVKAVCKKHNIHYHEPGFFQGNAEMLSAMKRAALSARKTTVGDGGFYQSKIYEGLNLSG